jgi:hypothetical protein
VWSQDRIQDAFKHLNLGSYSLIVTALLALVGIQLVDRIALALVDRLRWLRRMLSGKNDIEGDWVNVVMDPSSPNAPLKVEYCRIYFNEGKYILAGDTWTLDGEWTGDFITSGGSYYEGRDLEYYYKRGIDGLGGVGFIHMRPPDSLPREWTCRFINEDTKRVWHARGGRVSTKLRDVPTEDRRRVALAFAAKFTKVVGQEPPQTLD